MKKGILLFFAVVCFFYVNLFALSADDAGFVETKHFEFEACSEFSNGDSGDSTDLSFGITYGIFKNADFGISLPYNLDPDSEVGDVEFGFKYSFIPDRFAVTLGYVAADNYEISTAFVYSYEIKSVVLNLNLGYSKVEDESEGEIAYTLAFETEVFKNFTAGAEYIGSYTDGESSGEVGMGCSYTFSDQLSGNGEIIFDVDNSSNAVFSASLTFSL